MQIAAPLDPLAPGPAQLLPAGDPGCLIPCA